MKATVIECLRTISIDLAQLSTQSCTQKTKQDTPDGVSCFHAPGVPLVSMHFPSARGVVEMIAEDGSTVLLAASGHIRSFIAQRMNEDGQQSSKANLAPITAKIIAYPTGSAFESDWIVHERARLVDLGLYAKLNEQNRRSVLVFDSQAGSWRVEDTLSLGLDETGLAVGPILTKQAAKSLGETLDDVYELCRYPKELALAPNGSACAYKQMGRCPAACDGSEPMEAYRERFASAQRSAADGLGAWKKQLKDEIQSASAELDFEHAQLAQRQLGEVEKLAADALGLAQPMAGMRLVCITPSVRKGWAMVWGLGGDGLAAMVGVSEDQPGMAGVIESLMGESVSGGVLDQLWLDRFALVARHWMTKASKARRRRVTILDLNDARWRSQVSKAIAQACEAKAYDDDSIDEEQTHIQR